MLALQLLAAQQQQQQEEEERVLRKGNFHSPCSGPPLHSHHCRHPQDKSSSSSVGNVSYHRLLVVTLFLACTVSFWMGRIVSDHYVFCPPNIHANQTAAEESSNMVFSQHFQARRLPPKHWLAEEEEDETTRGGGGAIPSYPTPVIIIPEVQFASPVMNHQQQVFQQEDTIITATNLAAEAAATRYFQELVVHPAMMTSIETVHRVAIVLQQEQGALLLPGFLQQLQLYPSLQHIFLVTPNDCDGLEDTWRSSSPTIHCVTQDHLPASFQVDIVFLLDECDDVYKDNKQEEKEEVEEDLEASFRFWFEHLSPASGTLVTCLGRNFPLDHPLAWPQHQERIQVIEALDDAQFPRTVEYDIRVPGTRYAQSMAVAMKNHVAMAQWRMNQAHYARRMQARLQDDSLLQWFDSATMLSLKYPSKHSALRFCAPNGNYYLENEDQDDLVEICAKEGHGYDPFADNIPTDNLYLSKSKAGDHAGRGVFTKVDIPTDTYIGLETTVQSVLYEWTTTYLHDHMMELVPEYADSKAHVIYVFAEAYGYAHEPWNMLQEAVLSNLLTFVNHGCNGTANLGDTGLLGDAATTEFTIDLESGVIPDALRSTIDVAYAPHFDRDQMKQETVTRATRPIRAGEELYDNYIDLGGDTFFKEMVEMLRQECSGSFGMVEQYQKGEKVVSDKLKVMLPPPPPNHTWMFGPASDEL